MTYDLRDVLKGLRGGGGRQQSDPNAPKAKFWKKPKPGDPAKTTAFRLYRFPVDGVKTVCDTRKNHNAGTPQKPDWVPCLGNGCSICTSWQELRKMAFLDELNRKAALKKADEIRPQVKFTFVGIDTAEPVGFTLIELPEGASKKVFLAAAKEAGWIGGYPDRDCGDEKLNDYDSKVKQGLDGLCGPTGRDLAVTANPQTTSPSEWYTVDVVRATPAILVFPEDDNVPVPSDIRSRIDAARSGR